MLLKRFVSAVCLTTIVVIVRKSKGLAFETAFLIVLVFVSINFKTRRCRAIYSVLLTYVQVIRVEQETFAAKKPFIELFYFWIDFFKLK